MTLMACIMPNRGPVPLGLTQLRRSAEADRNWQACDGPHPDCPCDGGRCGERRLVKKGTTRGQRHAWCRACGRRLALTSGTPAGELAHDPALCARALRAMAAGHSSRATARLIPGAQATVCTWLDRAAQPSRLVTRYGWPQRPRRAWP